jgi:hypothetical protein
VFSWEYCWGKKLSQPIRGGQLLTLKAQAEQQQKELPERERKSPESQLAVRAMLDAWHPKATADGTPKGARTVRRMFERHLLALAGDVLVKPF